MTKKRRISHFRAAGIIGEKTVKKNDKKKKEILRYQTHGVSILNILSSRVKLQNYLYHERVTDINPLSGIAMILLQTLQIMIPNYLYLNRFKLVTEYHNIIRYYLVTEWSFKKVCLFYKLLQTNKTFFFKSMTHYIELL